MSKRRYSHAQLWKLIHACQQMAICQPIPWRLLFICYKKRAMSKIQVVSLLDNVEDVNLNLPEGLFLVTKNKPLCFDTNHHHYVVISAHLDDAYNHHTFQYATYGNRPRYPSTSVVSIARQLPPEKVDQYRGERRPVTWMPIKGTELCNIIVETQEAIKKHFRRLDLEELLQLVKPITHHKALSDRGIYPTADLPLSGMAYPPGWKEISVQDPIPQEFTVFADYYEGPNQGEWVIHYAKYGELFACLTDHHAWANTHQPLARLMFIGDQTEVNWFKRSACVLAVSSLQKHYGKLDTVRQIWCGDTLCNIENYATELIAHATPKELQGMLSRLHKGAGPLGYKWLSLFVTTALHRNKDH